MPKKVDRNHGEIRDYLRDNGCSVLDVHALPDFCDLVVGYLGHTVLVEVKDGDKPLTESQKRLLVEFKGWYEIVRDERDAARLMRAIEARDEILCPMPKAEIDGNR